MARFILLSCVLCLCIPFSAGAEPVSVPAVREQFHLYLLVGQSNMAGRGTVEQQDTAPHPRVLMLSKAEQWVPAADPMHFDPRLRDSTESMRNGLWHTTMSPWIVG